MVAIFRTIDQLVRLQQRQRQRNPELNTVTPAMSLNINATRTTDHRELTQFGASVIRDVDARPRPAPPAIDPLPQGVGASVFSQQEFRNRTQTPQERQREFNQLRIGQSLDFNVPRTFQPNTQSQIDNLRQLQTGIAPSQRAPVTTQGGVLSTASPEQRQQAAVQRRSGFAENFVPPQIQQELRSQDPTGRGLLPTTQFPQESLLTKLGRVDQPLLPDSVLNLIDSVPGIGDELRTGAEFASTPSTLAAAAVPGVRFLSCGHPCGAWR